MRKETDNVEETITQVGEYRVRHQDCVFTVMGTTYSWTELGSDQRFVEWMYGHWSRGFGGDDFNKYVMETLDKGAIQIFKYIKDNYDVGDSDEIAYTYIADKVMKSIAFGATWVQMLRYIDKEVSYYRRNPYRRAKNAHGDME